MSNNDISTTDGSNSTKPDRRDETPSFYTAAWRKVDLAIALALVVLWLWFLFKSSGSQMRLWQLWVVNLLRFAIPLSIPLILVRRRLGRWPRILLDAKGILKDCIFAALVVGVLLVLVFGANFAWTTISGDVSAKRVQWPYWAAMGRVGGLPALLAMILITFTLAPVAEEVFFRGFLFNTLRRVMPATGAAFLQAAVFALFHPYGLVGMALVFATGLILVSLYDARKSLLAPILAHAGFNFLVSSYFAYLVFTAPTFGLDGDDWHVEVVQVRAGSPADQAGLKPGDLILRFGGEPVNNVDDLNKRIKKSQEEQRRAAIVILRDNIRMKLAPVAVGSDFEIDGKKSVGPIVVTFVRPNTSSKLAGIVPGDIIDRFGGEEVSNLDKLRHHVESKRTGQIVPVEIIRDGETQTIDVKMYGRFYQPEKQEEPE